MALVPAICTQCGAQLEVDNTQEAAICKYCGTPFIVEKAINQYTTNITNNFDNAIIHMEGFDCENLLELAQFAYESKNYASAMESCDKILSVDTKNYKAWMLKAQCAGWIDSSINNPKCYEALQTAKKAIELMPDSEKQKAATDLQNSVCLQTMALINIYSRASSMFQAANMAKLALFINTYIEALKLPYVKANVLEKNADIIIKKLSKSEDYGEALFYEYVKRVQKEFNQYHVYADMIAEIRDRGKKENEIQYWKDYPDVLASQKSTFLAEAEEEYSEWETVRDKYLNLKERLVNAQNLVKQNQFKMFGEGGKIRKENEKIILDIKREILYLEDDYNHRKKNVAFLENKLQFLKTS